MDYVKFVESKRKAAGAEGFSREDVDAIDALRARAEAAEARVAELEALINTPRTADWLEAVRLEAAHQIERWGTSHDAGKAPADWFWLLGYLGGKALSAQLAGNTEKALHHTISTGAALLNWHRAITGESTAMRPGIAPPEAPDGPEVAT